MLAIYIDAGYTPSGNPKRGWIIADDAGTFIDFVEEGYIGNAALLQAGYNCPTTQRLAVPASVYNELARDAAKNLKNINHPRTRKNR